VCTDSKRSSLWKRAQRALPSEMVMLGCQDVGRPVTFAQDSGDSKIYRHTPKALKRGAGFRQSGSHGRQFLVLVISAMVVGVAQSSK
ncbi:unnamed protein product, partial [Ectocarpus sp. 4 AP-2014]